MWKLKLYGNDFKSFEEMELPDAVAEMIFSNKNLKCSKDYPRNKIFSNEKCTAVFDKIPTGYTNYDGREF